MHKTPKTLNPYISASSGNSGNSGEEQTNQADQASRDHDDEVLDFRARLTVAQRVLEWYRSDLKQRDAELKQKEDELNQTNDILKQTNIWYTAQHKTLDELKKTVKESDRLLKQREDELKDHNEWYTVLENDYLELQQRQHETACANMRLQGEAKHVKKYMDDRGDELREVDKEKETLLHELAHAKAEVETLRQRMRRWNCPDTWGSVMVNN